MMRAQVGAKSLELHTFLVKQLCSRAKGWRYAKFIQKKSSKRHNIFQNQYQKYQKNLFMSHRSTNPEQLIIYFWSIQSSRQLFFYKFLIQLPPSTPSVQNIFSKLSFLLQKKDKKQIFIFLHLFTLVKINDMPLMLNIHALNTRSYSRSFSIFICKQTNFCLSTNLIQFVFIFCMFEPL